MKTCILLGWAMDSSPSEDWTAEKINEWLCRFPDDSLITMANTAMDDLKIEAERSPNSEWHGACFAAFYMFCEEMNRRGLKLK